MQMIVERDSFWELKNHSWSGAIDTLNTIEEHDKEDEFMSFLEDVFCGETPTATQVNDFIWFDWEYIFECLGINEDEEDEDDEEEE